MNYTQISNIDANDVAARHHEQYTSGHFHQVLDCGGRRTEVSFYGSPDELQGLAERMLADVAAMRAELAERAHQQALPVSDATEAVAS